MTKIEWADEVWNPVTGCTKVSDGCKNCYAERVANRFWGERKFTDVQVHEDRLKQPLLWRKPRRIFVNSMSDLFHEDIPFDFIDKVFAVMALTPRHTYQVLTKRPERMREYLSGVTLERLAHAVPVGDWPISYFMAGQMICGVGSTAVASARAPLPWPLHNVWLGVSVEDQKTADERIPLLLQTPAAIRFVSHEPALEYVDFRKWLPEYCNACGEKLYSSPSLACNCEWITEPPFIDWIIAGGESGPKARPSHPDWFRAVRDQCKAAGVPFFFKQWGEWGQYNYNTYFDPNKNLALFSKTDGGDDPIYLESAERKGQWFESWEHDDQWMERVGKKQAGRSLDGVEHDEFPDERKNYEKK